jgi:hypothetical protein
LAIIVGFSVLWRPLQPRDDLFHHSLDLRSLAQRVHERKISLMEFYESDRNP